MVMMYIVIAETYGYDVYSTDWYLGTMYVMIETFNYEVKYHFYVYWSA